MISYTILMLRKLFLLLPLVAANHTGRLPDAQSFLDVREENVIVSAVKKSEDGDTLMIRLYEWAGRGGDVHLRLPSAAASAATTNLMEHDEHALTPEADAITVPVSPYEIKTVKVTLR